MTDALVELGDYEGANRRRPDNAQSGVQMRQPMRVSLICVLCMAIPQAQLPPCV